MLGLALFWVGAVLFCNGLWLLGRIGDNEIAVIDVFVGVVTGAVAFYLAFVVGDPASIRGAALTLLFSFTYFWVAWNRYNGADGRGLGWFCLFVAITTVPVFLDIFAQAQHHLGSLVRYFLGIVGSSVVPVLPDTRPQRTQLIRPRASFAPPKVFTLGGYQDTCC